MLTFKMVNIREIVKCRNKAIYQKIYFFQNPNKH